MGIVGKGNKIHIPASELTANELTIELQQNVTNRRAQYYCVPFCNKSQGDEQSVLFIEKNYLEQFKLKAGNQDFTIDVDNSFQYGQNNEKDRRWLVFHDKSMKAYEWHFLTSAVQKLGSNAVKFAGALFKPYTYVDVTTLKAHFGEFLKTFEQQL